MRYVVGSWVERSSWSSLQVPMIVQEKHALSLEIPPRSSWTGLIAQYLHQKSVYVVQSSACEDESQKSPHCKVLQIRHLPNQPHPIMKQGGTYRVDVILLPEHPLFISAFQGTRRERIVQFLPWMRFWFADLGWKSCLPVQYVFPSLKPFISPMAAEVIENHWKFSEFVLWFMMETSCKIWQWLFTPHGIFAVV